MKNEHAEYNNYIKELLFLRRYHILFIDREHIFGRVPAI